MPDFTKRVRKRLALPAGEHVVQAAVAQPSGSVSRGFAENRTSLGALSSSLGAKMADDRDTGGIAERIPKKNGYLVVTDLRVLWADQNKTGSVGDIVAQFAFDEIAAVELTDGGGMSNKLLSFTFADQSGIDVAVAKGQQPDKLHAALLSALA